MKSIDIKRFVARIETLEKEKASLLEDINEIYNEAKSEGYDTKIMRKVVALRKKDTTELEEEKTVIEMYLNAAGA